MISEFDNGISDDEIDGTCTSVVKSVKVLPNADVPRLPEQPTDHIGPQLLDVMENMLLAQEQRLRECAEETIKLRTLFTQIRQHYGPASGSMGSTFDSTFNSSAFSSSSHTTVMPEEIRRLLEMNSMPQQFVINEIDDDNEDNDMIDADHDDMVAIKEEPFS